MQTKTLVPNRPRQWHHATGSSEQISGKLLRSTETWKRPVMQMLVDRIYAHARQQPQRVAMVTDGQSVSYLHFAQGIECLRSAWAELDLTPGSVAAVITDNRLLGWSATLALQSLGLVTIGADTVASLLSLDLHRVSWVLMSDTSAENMSRVKARWPKAWPLHMPHERLAMLNDMLIPEGFVSVPGGGHILYTSGTTGTYKQIFHDAACDSDRYQAQRHHSKEPDVMVANVSFFGLWTAIGYRRPLFIWSCGATIVFDRRSDWALHLADHGVTQVFLTPGQLQEAVNALNADAAVLPTGGPRWRFDLFVGGGVTSASLIRATLAHITAHLTLSFGCTEMWLPIMRTAAQGLDDDFWLKPQAGRDIDIVDENGMPCPDMVEGRLRIRMQSTDYSGYMNDPQSSAKMFQAGWFYPGDLAIRRADGRIRVLGRAVDVINVRGRKIASAPLEETLREGLGVSAVCAFSGLMADGEDRLFFAIETREPIAQERYQQVAEQCLKGLGDIQFVQVDAFPRTQTGMLKIDRISLRQQIMAALQKH
ncbi:MAG: class I adenylate-forming enzyme family protein [Limnohabitans sp.]